MRYIVFMFSMILTVFLIIGCGDDEGDEDLLPTTGSVSGTVTFVGEPPEDPGEIQVSIWSVLGPTGQPAGPPDHYSDVFEAFTGEVQYKISGISFGTYKMVAVGYEPTDAPMSTPETVLGAYDFAPPSDMEPGSFTVSEDQPDATGIDIIADYGQISQ